jgi:RNA polymerase primary sigma factor
MTKQQTQDDRHVSLMARDQYVRSVKWTPSAQEGEEEHLLERIKRGKVERQKVCPDWRVCQDAETARDRLVAMYQRMVMHFAGKYVRCRRTLDFDDLVQEGNLGLLEAIGRSDQWKGPFEKLVSVCVSHAMLRAIYSTDRPVRLPAYLCQELFQMRRVRSRLFDALGREPLLAEIAAEMAVTEVRVLELKDYKRRGNAESLQAVVGEYEEEEEVFDFVSVFAATVAAETARQEELQSIVRQAMETGLTPRLREVITLRYGLDGGESHRVVDLARELGLKVHSVDVSIIRAKRHLQAALAAPCAKYYDDIVA